MTKTSLAGRKIAYYDHSGQHIIAIVTSHDLDTDILTVGKLNDKQMTLLEVNYRLGGATVHLGDDILLNI